MKNIHRILISFVIVHFALQIGSAQNAARVTSILAVKNQPEVKATLNVQCGGQPYYELSPSQLQLTDNENRVDQFTIETYASAQTRNPFSAVLVLDCSGSMSGAGNAGVKAASHAFVDFMDSTTDEMEIIWFNSIVTVFQLMTQSRSLLRRAIDGLPANGSTAVWDGAYRGLIELAVNATKQSQAVVVLTDGGDNSSSNTPTDVIALANANNERVFTIGLGSTIQASQLQAVATQTGGLYFEAPSASELTTIFTMIASFMRRGFDEYTLRYTSPDPSADKHTLEISIVACAEPVSGSATRPAKIVSEVGNGLDVMPEAISLLTVTPNPVRAGVATFGIQVARTFRQDLLSLKVFDVLGREYSLVTTPTLQPGLNQLRFPTTSLSAGMYFLRLIYGVRTQTQRFIIIP